MRRAASTPSSTGIFTSRIARSGLPLAGEHDGLAAVARFEDLVPGAFEHAAQVEPDNRLVFGDQDPHRAPPGW